MKQNSQSTAKIVIGTALSAAIYITFRLVVNINITGSSNPLEELPPKITPMDQKRSELEALEKMRSTMKPKEFYLDSVKIEEELYSLKNDSKS